MAAIFVSRFSTFMAGTGFGRRFIVGVYRCDGATQRVANEENTFGAEGKGAGRFEFEFAGFQAGGGIDGDIGGGDQRDGDGRCGRDGGRSDRTL